MENILSQALIAHFDSVFKGPNGDYPTVLEAFAGLTAIQAAWKPAPGCNSISQIVDHITDSKVWQIEMLEKGHAASSVWTQPTGDEVAWQTTMERLNDAHEQLKIALVKVPEDSLLLISVPEANQTQLELLLSSAANEAYHSGQIDYLKGLQAAQQNLQTFYSTLIDFPHGVFNMSEPSECDPSAAVSGYTTGCPFFLPSW